MYQFTRTGFGDSVDSNRTVDKRDFEVEIVPTPEPELIIIEGDTDG